MKIRIWFKFATSYLTYANYKSEFCYLLGVTRSLEISRKPHQTNELEFFSPVSPLEIFSQLKLNQVNCHYILVLHQKYVPSLSLVSHNFYLVGHHLYLSWLCCIHRQCF